MPRNSTGKYFLPAGNPVASGEVISSDWANNTLSDLATAVTDSLDRNGLGGMKAPMKLSDGTQSAPGLGFTNESNTGLYRPSDKSLGMTVAGVSVLVATSSGFQMKPNKRIGLPDAPQSGSDAANKAYVDNAQISAESYAKSQAQDAKDYALGLIPSGTRMLFQQSNAPAGWTKDTTQDNKALRVVSGAVGSGGAVGFTTAFASRSVSDTALDTDQMPEHTHGFSATTSTAGNHSHSGSTSKDGTHDHNFRWGQNSGSSGSTAGSGIVSYPAHNNLSNIDSAGNHSHSLSTNTTGNHTHSFSGNTSSTGSGRAHSHQIDLSVAYVDVIIGVKD